MLVGNNIASLLHSNGSKDDNKVFPRRKKMSRTHQSFFTQTLSSLLSMNDVGIVVLKNKCQSLMVVEGLRLDQCGGCEVDRM